MYIKYVKMQCICKIYNVLSNNKKSAIFSYIHLLPDLCINQIIINNYLIRINKGQQELFYRWLRYAMNV